MREGGGIPVDCAQSNFSSLICIIHQVIKSLHLYSPLINVSLTYQVCYELQ